MKSFLTGRADVGVLDSPNSTEVAQPSVQCVREGDVIKKLIVTCECGKIVEIDCQYGAGAL
jgi:hypothetical protein